MAQSPTEMISQDQAASPAPVAATVKKKKLTASPSYHGAKMMEIELEYPQVILTGNMSLTVAVNHYYTTLAQERYQQAMSSLLSETVAGYTESRKKHQPFIPALASMRYEVTYNRADYLSITTDFQYETATAPGRLERQAENWRLSDGSILRFNDFFLTTGYIGVLFPSLIRQIETLSAESGSEKKAMLLSDYGKSLFLRFDNRNFSLTGDGFTFFYPQGSITKPEAGIFSLSIPYSDFKDHYARGMQPVEFSQTQK